jgi:hypothetical protein
LPTSQTGTSPENTIVAKKNRFFRLAVNPVGKKIIIAAGTLLAILITLLIIAVITQPTGTPSEPDTPVTKITPAPSPEIILNPSAYADDPEVGEIESGLKAIETDLIEVDLRESSLNPPSLDMVITFES